MEMEAQRFPSFDGVEIAWREAGEGRPLVLLHGLFSNAETNWIRFGTASLLAEAGVRVILPDFRGHGRSDAPHDATSYPPDVLVRDVAAFVRHLGLEDFDLGGYSLGARTSIRAVVAGVRPRRLVLAGMGLDGVLHTDARTAFFLRVIENRDSARPGAPEWMAAQFLKTTRSDPEAVAHVLRSQVQTTREELAAVTMPALVVSGSEDRDNGSAAELAAVLPDARYVEVPGNHMTAVTGKEIGLAIRDFLGDASP